MLFQFLPIWSAPIAGYLLYIVIKKKVSRYWPGMEVTNLFLMGWFISCYLISTIYYFVQIVPRTTDMSTETICFILFNFVLAYFYMKLAYGDPGVIHPNPPNDIKDYIHHIENNNTVPKLCPTCRIIRPPRSKHDRKDNVCVERFDHYCFWVRNSIGKKNHRVFLFLLVLVSSLHVWFVRLVYITLMRMTKDVFSIQLFYSAAPMLVVLEAIHLFHGGWELWLFYSQLKNVKDNITINEMSNWNK
jgi:palmitoyltransferase